MPTPAPAATARRTALIAGLCAALGLAGCHSHATAAQPTDGQPTSASATTSGLSGLPGSRAAASPSSASPRSPASDPSSASALDLGPMYTLGYRLEWRGYPQVSASAGIKFINILGDSLAVQDGRNVLTVMEPATGANRWSLDLGSSLTKFVGNVRLNDKLLCSSEYEVQVLDIRTGQIKARQRLAALANTPPVVNDPILIYGGSGGEILAHNSYSGFKLGAYRLSGAINAKPIVVGDSVAAVSQAGDVIFLDARSGESRGRRRGIFGGVENELVANQTTLFIASTDQSIWAINSSDAKVSWRVRTPDPLTSQPMLHEDKLYQYVPSWGFSAFDASTGAKLWSNPKVTGSAIALRNGRLLVWDRTAHAATLVDPARGDIVEHADLPGDQMFSFDAPVDGNAYVARADGSVEKYSPR